MNCQYSDRLYLVALTLCAIACEAILYGPSMSGRLILAPTDLLIYSGILPRESGTGAVEAENRVLLDLVEVIYPGIRFASSELRAGRLPLWNPYTYCGSPFLASHPSAVFQPFALPYYLWPDPRVFVWTHLLKTLVAGIGTFLFLRRIGASQWGSLVGGLCFGHVGYFVAWLGFPLSACAVWLPWGFLAVESMVWRPSGWGGPALAAIIGVLLFSGHLETAAQLFVAIGSYGVWRWCEQIRMNGWRTQAAQTVLVAALAGLVGFGAGALQLLPTTEYLHSSLRMLQRKHGLATEDVMCDRRSELVRLAFPYLLGTAQRGSHPIAPLNFNESSANGHVGFTLLVLLAPLGVAANWRQARTWYWILIALMAAAPLFRIPILNWWSRVPPFDLMRNNRMLLVTGWAALVLGIQGLDALLERRRGLLWVGLFAALTSAIVTAAMLCVILFQPAAFLIEITYKAWPWFRAHLTQYACITAAGAACLIWWRFSRTAQRGSAIILGLLAVAELVASERGYNPQAIPTTYYPEHASIQYVVDQVGDSRICGLRGILTPNTGLMYGLRDVRGYDSVDPLPYLELLRVSNFSWTPPPSYALTRTFWSGPSPVLDLLGVRYLLASQELDTTWELVHHSGAIWVYHNPKALPRVFVPQRAVVVPQSDDRLRVLGNPEFDPRQLVLISEPCNLPQTPARGDGRIVAESPCRVEIAVRADSDAVVVLADSWAPGWNVRVDGAEQQPLQADHALRAVRVSTGDHVIVWEYFPASVRRGIWISSIALIALAGWCCLPLTRLRETTTPRELTSGPVSNGVRDVHE